VVIIVTQIDNINENTVIQTGQRQTVAPAAGFQSSLEIALARGTGAKTENTQAAALSEPPAAAHLNPAAAPSADDIACQTESLLGLLESYANGLGSPGATLKDLAPLVNRIKAGAEQLMELAQKSTSAGSGLKDIASRAALTANTEYIKFQRGDYV
jgi:hypothetical protein